MTSKKYHHLSQDQGYQLEKLGSRGLTTRMIADEIGVSASTVSREKARNSDKNGEYNHLFEEQQSRKRGIVSLTPFGVKFLNQQAY